MFAVDPPPAPVVRLEISSRLGLDLVGHRAGAVAASALVAEIGRTASKWREIAAGGELVVLVSWDDERVIIRVGQVIGEGRGLDAAARSWSAAARRMLAVQRRHVAVLSDSLERLPHHAGQPS